MQRRLVSEGTNACAFMSYDHILSIAAFGSGVLTLMFVTGSLSSTENSRIE